MKIFNENFVHSQRPTSFNIPRGSYKSDYSYHDSTFSIYFSTYKTELVISMNDMFAFSLIVSFTFTTQDGSILKNTKIQF